MKRDLEELERSVGMMGKCLNVLLAVVFPVKGVWEGT